MLERNIAPKEVFITDHKGEYTITGNIGDGATVDCRNCKLTILGDRGQNVKIHSIGEPHITGEKGDNVTYYIYDESGNLRTKKILGAEGSLSVGKRQSCTFVVSSDTVRITNSLSNFSSSSTSVLSKKEEQKSPVVEKNDLDLIDQISADKQSDEKESNESFSSYSISPTSMGNIKITPVGGKIYASQGSSVNIHTVSSDNASQHYFFTGQSESNVSEQQAKKLPVNSTPAVNQNSSRCRIM